MYPYRIYLKTGADCELAGIKADMDAYFKDKKSKKPDKTEIRRDVLEIKDTLVVTYKGYEFYILINKADYVNKELQKLMDRNKGLDFADNPIDIAAYKDSNTNIDMFGDEDLDMEFFNECIFILEYFESVGEYLIFNG